MSRYPKGSFAGQVVAEAARLLLPAVVICGVLSPWSVNAQQSFVRQAVLLEPVGGSNGYRIVLEVEPVYLSLHESALPGPALFIGEQPIYHTFGSSGNLLEGFILELPAPTDTIWFASIAEFPDVQQARAHFDASGVPPTTVDINALLAEGERLQKRITDVEIVVECRILPDGTESIQYVVKLTVEKCTEENFAGFGVLGAAWPPSVFVGERVADRTFFSVDEQVVVGEFDDEPEDGAEITLRYTYQRLIAPEPFQLP